MPGGQMRRPPTFQTPYFRDRLRNPETRKGLNDYVEAVQEAARVYARMTDLRHSPSLGLH